MEFIKFNTFHITPFTIIKKNILLFIVLMFIIANISKTNSYTIYPANENHNTLTAADYDDPDDIKETLNKTPNQISIGQAMNNSSNHQTAFLNNYSSTLSGDSDDNISFLQKKQGFDTFVDNKSSSTPFNLEQMSGELPSERNLENIPDPKEKISRIESDQVFKTNIMKKLLNKDFSTSKIEAFNEEFSYDKSAKNKQGDDFVAYLGFLGDVSGIA